MPGYNKKLLEKMKLLPIPLPPPPLPNFFGDAFILANTARPCQIQLFKKKCTVHSTYDVQCAMCCLLSVLSVVCTVQYDV